MTTLDSTQAPRRVRVSRCSQVAVVSAASATLVLWALARTFGVDLVVRTGGDTRTVGWLSVLVASVLATMAGLALLRALEARLARGRQVWTGIATGVFVASLLAGPAAATHAAAALSLGAMHAAVWLVLLERAWRCR